MAKKAKDNKTNKKNRANKKVEKDNLAYASEYAEESVFWEKLEDSFRIQVIVAIVLSVIFALTLTTYLILQNYTVTNVYVEGNEHYTAAEIRSMIVKGKFGDNTIYLSMKYSGKSITDIPFIEKMDVSVVDKNTIRITVYEKALAGYVEYIGNYIYFDKDGVVVESSNIKTSGIPLVSGLEFDHFVMYQKLPVENDDLFQVILNVTQLLGKYDIDTDRIYFAKDGKMTLYFEGVRVGMGESRLLEEKIQKLNAILPELNGKNGYLELGTYDNGNEDFTFTLDR